MQIRKPLALLGIATVMSAFVVTDKDTASAQSSIGRGVRQCLAQHSPVRFLDSSREERMRQRRLLRACIRSVIFGNGGNGSSSSRSSVSSLSSSSRSSLSSSSVSSQSSNSNSSVSSNSSSLSSVSSSRSSSLSSSSLSSASSVSSNPSSTSSVSSSVSSSPSSMSSVSSNLSSSLSSAVSSVGTAQTTASVNIDNMAFTPGTLTVKKGTRITWTNNDDTAHTVTRDGSQGPYSSVLSEDESYSRTFGTVGTYNYHCAIHPEMKGTIVVTE